MTEHWSIRRHGRNEQYKNPGGLRFAPASNREAEIGVVYLAGKYHGGKRCVHPGCDRWIATTSPIRRAGVMVIPDLADPTQDRYLGIRWIHADHPMHDDFDPRYTIDRIVARRGQEVAG